MKWFLIFVAIWNDGSMHMTIQDTVYYETPTKCEAARLIVQANVNKVPGRPTARMFCAGNHVVGDFEYQGEQ